MMYSCAVFPDEAGGVRGDLGTSWSADDLDVAQMYKLQMVLRKARVRPGDRVLEFGTGWGSMAIEVRDAMFPSRPSSMLMSGLHRQLNSDATSIA